MDANRSLNANLQTELSSIGITRNLSVPIAPTMGERFCNLWAALYAGKRATDAFRDFDEIAALSSFGLTRGYALRLITRQPN